MAWKLVNPNITNDPSYLDPRLSDDESKISSNTTSLAQNTNYVLWNAVNVKTPFHGLTPAKGDGVTDDTSAIQSILNYCVTNNLDVYFPSGTYITTAELFITGYIRIYGVGKNTNIQCNGTNLNILTIQFSAPTTMNYTFSNLEIRDLTITGNSSATTQNAICFNSVICIYNKLKNLRINNVNGSAIRLINDGSRTQKSFYCHNAYWQGIYLSATSEFLTQDTINGGSAPWIYGGEISDCHIEVSSSFRNKPYLFELPGFHNMSIKDIITEGNVNTSFTSVFKCTDNAIFTNIYFEFVLQNGSTIDSYFELSGGRYKIHNPVNLDRSCIKTTATNTIVEVEGGTYKTLNTLNHASSVGKLIIKKPSYGSWFSGVTQDNVIPYYNQMVSIQEADLGTNVYTKTDSVELYRLDKGAYLSNYFWGGIVSQFNSGTMPTLSMIEDPVYGRCLKFVPVDANNAVFAGVKLALGTNYIGKNVTVIARYKWQSSNLQVTGSGLVGSFSNVLMDNTTPVNDTWRIAAQLAQVDGSGNVYARFDYNAPTSYTAPQNLIVSEILILWGSVIPTLPLRDDRLLTMRMSAVPTQGTFRIGDECFNDLSIDTIIYKWVYTSQGWKTVKFS